ncbi:MAG TPA: S53 family peptidase [Terriglobia bacterium]
MEFKLTSGQQAALDTLLQQQQDPTSSSYHRWLTPEQYADRFGLTTSDLAKVVSWLQDMGFSIDETARSRTWVAFSGDADQVEASFHTSIHHYVMNGAAHYANATEPSLPAALAPVVLAIRSLSNFRPKPQLIRRRVIASPNPRFTSSVSGNYYLAPADFATIYDVQSLYNAGITGAGEKIAVMGQTDIVLSDIEEFRSAAGLPANDPTVVTIPAYVSITSTGDLTEADLDLEWSGAVARNASIIYVNAGDSANGAFDSLTYAIDINVAPVVSISYGSCEQDVGSADASAMETEFQQANSQGMTIVGAGGDDGATDCDNNNPAAPSDIAVSGLAVDFPASAPNVTGVGGTEFYNDTATGGNAYWSATNNSTTQGSALSYIPEMVWNDTAEQGELAAGGGGASIFFTKPSWQTGVGVPNDDARDVPDVALDASPVHDPYLICSSDYTNQDAGVADCTSGFRASDQTLDVVGGSSVGPPTFSGIVALINQKTGSAQGNINEILYPLAAAVGDAFHDITNGNNEEPCQAGTPNCPNGGQIGFIAAPGYDQASGLGSVDAFNLVTKWSSVKPITGTTPDFAVSSSPASLTVASGGSGSATLTVVPNNAFSGTVSFTCSVGSALSGVTCSVSPATLMTSGTTTLSVAASTSAQVLGGMRFPSFRWLQALGLLTCGLLLGWARLRVGKSPLPLARVVPRGVWLAFVIVCLLAAGVSCGGGGNTSTTTTTSATSETGNVTVTAVSGSTTHTAQVTVIVN